MNNSFVIPPTLLTGSYNVSVRTDYRNQVFELNSDNNNLRWILITIRERYCDLIAGNISYHIEATNRGNLLRYSYTVENIGGGPTIGGPWIEQLTISPTHENDGDQTVLRTLLSQYNLPVGRSYWNSIVQTIPQNTHGTLYLRLEIDVRNQIIEEDKSNNVARSSAVNVLPLYADLAVQNLSIINASRILGGDDITLQWSVINQGEVLAHPLHWYDSVSLSPTQTLDNTLKLVDVIVYNDALEPQRTYQQRRVVTLPLELDYSLTYRLILQVNSREHVNENDQLQNNLRSMVISITPPPSPDLRVVSVSYTYFPPSRILTAQWEVRNIGNTMRSIMSWRDQVFISSRSSFNPSTSFILGHRDQSLRLLADQVYTLRESFFVPSSLSGQFYIYVVTDVSNSVMEIGGEENGVRRSDATLAVAQAPTVTLNISINHNSLPPSYFTGQSFTMEYSVVNSGDVAVGTTSWVDGIYLSNVANPSRSYLLSEGLLLVETLNNMQLDRNDSYTKRLDVTLPHNIRGQQFLTVLLDMNNALDVQTVGTSGTIITIEQGFLPDLTVSAISNNLNITSGQPATIEYSVMNEGESAASGLWYEALILSTDAEIDPFDTRLRTVRNPPVGSLRVNESYNQSIEVFIPYDLPTSFYYIFIIADPRNDLHEEMTDNNRDHFILFITETVSTDIAVFNVRVSPTSSTYGDMMTYTYTLRNNGSLLARGYKCDSIYLSEDNTWDLNDFEIDLPVCSPVTISGYLNNVRNDRMYSRRAIAPFIANGGYYGLVRTRTNIRDPNLSNNIGSTSSIIEINAPNIVLGRVTRIALAPNDIRVFQIQGVPGGEALVANLTTDQLYVYHDLYLRHRQTPTGAEHDAFSQFALSPNQRAVVRHSREGTYYLRIESFTNSRINSNYNIDILVKIARFEILSITPITAAPLGNVTIKISGTVLSYFSFATLIDSSGIVAFEAIKMYWFNSESVFATFNITGASHGEYSIRLVDEKTGNIAQLNNSFNISTGIPGQLATNVQAPRPLRVGQTGETVITVENIGNTDILAPYLVLVSTSNAHFKLLDTSGPIDFSQQIDFLCLNLEGPAGILPPGASTRVTFRVAQVTSQRNSRARFRVKIANNQTAPHPYLDKKSSLQPRFIPNEVWDTIWENFISSVGTTQKSFQQRMSEIASELSMVGKRTYSIQEMVTYQLQVAYGLLSGIF